MTVAHTWYDRLVRECDTTETRVGTGTTEGNSARGDTENILLRFEFLIQTLIPNSVSM